MLLFTLLFLFQTVFCKLILHLDEHVTLPTSDYFQVRYPYSEHNNALIVLARPLTESKNCEFRDASQEQETAAKHTSPINADSTIFFLTQAALIKAGCVNINQAVTSAQKYGQLLVDELHYPPLSVVVIGMGRGIPKAIYGGPLTSPYSSRKYGLPDGKPPVETSFLQPEGALAVQKALRSSMEAGNALIADYSQEMGPWNTLFLGVPFLIYNYALMALNVLVLLFGCYKLMFAMRDKDLALDVRTLCFSLAVVADVLFIVSLNMYHRSWNRILLEQIASLILWSAFVFLLLLWIRLMEQSNLDVRGNSFRVFLGISMVSTLAQFGNTVANMLQVPDAQAKLRTAIMDMIFLCLQAVLTAIFLYYAVRFMIQKRNVRSGGETERALIGLSYLAIAAFAALFLAHISNSIALNSNYNSRPGGYLVMWITRTIALTIRIVALILILNVRPPTVTKLNRTNSTASNFSTMSKASTRTTPNVSSWLSKRSEQREKTINSIETD